VPEVSFSGRPPIRKGAGRTQRPMPPRMALGSFLRRFLVFCGRYNASHVGSAFHSPAHRNRIPALMITTSHSSAVTPPWNGTPSPRDNLAATSHVNHDLPTPGIPAMSVNIPSGIIRGINHLISFSAIFENAITGSPVSRFFTASIFTRYGPRRRQISTPIHGRPRTREVCSQPCIVGVVNLFTPSGPIVRVILYLSNTFPASSRSR